MMHVNPSYPTQSIHTFIEVIQVNHLRTTPAQAQHTMLVQVIRRESPTSATNGACKEVGAIGFGQSDYGFGTTT